MEQIINKYLDESLETMNYLIATDLAVVVKEKYPKGKYHFLVVSKENISGISALTRSHLPLLSHMKELANQIIEKQEDVNSNNFLIGFKRNVIMEGLTMHVVSDDFYSESMRRIHHWNSFNTELFIKYQIAYALICAQGSIEPISDEKAFELRSSLPLRCNQCDFETSRLAILKFHLFEHWEKRNNELKEKKEIGKVTDMLDETQLDEKPEQKKDQSKQANGQISFANCKKKCQQAGNLLSVLEYQIEIRHKVPAVIDTKSSFQNCLFDNNCLDPIGTPHKLPFGRGNPIGYIFLPNQEDNQQQL